RDRNVTGVQTCALPIFQVDAADQQSAERTVGRSGEDLGVVASRRGRELVDTPDSGDVHTRLGLRRRATPGEQTGQQPDLYRPTVSGTARHPGEPGAGGLDELEQRGVPAGHHAQALTGEDDRTL